jgi:hypothetical protein
VKNTQFQPNSNFAKPFSIGLQLLDGSLLFQPDSKFSKYINQKRSLFKIKPGEILMAQADTLDAQNEILEFVLDTIGALNSPTDDIVECPTLGTKYNRSDFSSNPLALASLLVQEDLVLMRRKQTTWHLVAASLCFPSSWNLAEKFGKPLIEIHQPVPGANDHLDPMILRIFDNLKPDMPVWRENWSIYADDELRHSSGEDARNNDGEFGKSGDKAFIRREYQTLHRLPKSQDILFTIRIIIEPLSILETQENPGSIAAQLLNQIDTMSEAQRQYKGFNQGMSHTRNYLQSLINSPTE